MYKSGHIGISLIMYAPIFALLMYNSHPWFALLGLIFVATFSPFPDKDINTPLFQHRGISHSILASVVFTLVIGILAYFFITVVTIIPVPEAPFVSFFMFIAFLTYISHLVGDYITPAGIRPYNPKNKKRIKSKNNIYAKNMIANWLFFAFGWLLIIGLGLLALGAVAG